MVSHLEHIFCKKQFLMPLISGLVEGRDRVEGCEFPTLNFSRKERENSAGPGTSANDLKQEWAGEWQRGREGGRPLRGCTEISHSYETV